MTKRTPLYMSDVAAFKANDNSDHRAYNRQTGQPIQPMEYTAPATRKDRIKRALFLLSLAGIGLSGLFYVGPKYLDLVLDRMEAQRVAEYHYDCARYGAELNRFYGRDVCEDPALHNELLKPENGETR